MRINKFLAHAGLASRRMSEQIIAEGVITINGVICTDPAQDIDPQVDCIMYRSKRLNLRTNKIYLMINKPVGYVCTNKDEYANKLVFDLIPYKKEKLFSIGRLDKDSEGLILVTNDGELSQHITQAKKKILKTYRVWVDGYISPNKMHSLQEKTIQVKGITYHLEKVNLKRKVKGGGILNFSLYEGKNRQIRKICEFLNLEVKKLKRIAIGPLELKEMPVACFRELSKNEINTLFQL